VFGSNLLNGCAKMYNMASKVREKTTRMNESLHYCNSEAQKIEHTS